MTKRVFTPEFKLQVVRQWLSGDTRLAQLCREHNLCETVVRSWRQQYEQQGEAAWQTPTPARNELQAAQARIATLEAALGRAHLEIEFLQSVLEKKGLRCGRKSP